MKKFFIVLVIFVLVFSVACSKPAEKKEDSKGSNKDFKVGFVTDTGGIDDKSFNQSTWEGVEQFQKEVKLDKKNIKYLQSNSENDYTPNLSQLADDKVNLVIAAGYKFEAAIKEVSKNYPKQHFLLVDMVVKSPNVLSAVFAEHEGSFLAGAAAALKAKSAGKKIVGFVGGEDGGLIQRFEAGFEQGVKAVDKDMEIKIGYAGSFVDAAKGQTIAAKMYDEGAYVIYHAAGGAGNGVIKEAVDRAKNGNDVWAIGVDRDQYEQGKYDGEKSIILTSMIKRVDQAAYQAAKMEYEGKFEGKVIEFGLANNGVSLPKENPNMKKEWLDKIEELKKKIINKEITVNPKPSRVNK